MGAGRQPASFPASEDMRISRMPEQSQKQQQRPRLTGQEYNQLVRRLTDRVWQMWIIELRQDRERRGQRRR